MRRRCLAWILTAGLGCAPAGLLAQSADSPQTAASLERIRRLIERQPAVVLDQRKPDFTIHITDREIRIDTLGAEPTRADPFLPWRRYMVNGTAVTAGGAAPVVRVDALGLALAAVNKIQDAWHRRSERKARERVQDEFARFCALHGCAVPAETAR